MDAPQALASAFGTIFTFMCVLGGLVIATSGNQPATLRQVVVGAVVAVMGVLSQSLFTHIGADLKRWARNIAVPLSGAGAAVYYVLFGLSEYDPQRRYDPTGEYMRIGIYVTIAIGVIVIVTSTLLYWLLPRKEGVSGKGAPRRTVAQNAPNPGIRAFVETLHNIFPTAIVIGLISRTVGRSTSVGLGEGSSFIAGFIVTFLLFLCVYLYVGNRQRLRIGSASRTMSVASASSAPSESPKN
jgi:hypothetical protein